MIYLGKKVNSDTHLSVDTERATLLSFTEKLVFISVFIPFSLKEEKKIMVTLTTKEKKRVYT